MRKTESWRNNSEIIDRPSQRRWTFRWRIRCSSDHRPRCSQARPKTDYSRSAPTVLAASRHVPTSLGEARDSPLKRETWKASPASYAWCFIWRKEIRPLCQSIKPNRETSINDPPDEQNERHARLCVGLRGRGKGSATMSHDEELGASLSLSLSLWASWAIARCRADDLSRAVGPFWSDIRFHRPSWHWGAFQPRAIVA